MTTDAQIVALCRTMAACAEAVVFACHPTYPCDSANVCRDMVQQVTKALRGIEAPEGGWLTAEEAMQAARAATPTPDANARLDRLREAIDKACPLDENDPLVNAILFALKVTP
jgi:hypothetical protein